MLRCSLLCVLTVGKGDFHKKKCLRGRVSADYGVDCRTLHGILYLYERGLKIKMDISSRP